MSKQYPEWVFKGHTELIPRANIIQGTKYKLIPDTGETVLDRGKYGDTGKCPVKWCRNPCSWWTCYNCNAPTCKAHQVFNGRIVIKCYYCNGNRQWQSWLKRLLRRMAKK